MIDRRDFLWRHAHGFGALALAALRAEAAEPPASGSAEGRARARTLDPMRVRAPHAAAKAKSVILLFMDGGVSHIDSFDPKPRVTRESGQPIPLQRPKLVRAESPLLWGSPYSFRRYGQCGADVSEMYPHVAQCVDDLTIVRSMAADHSEHTAANYFMHSGSGLQGRPSLGAWITYGLGSESRNLPGYIVLDTGMIPPGGLDLFGSGFLPASYQGSLFRRGAQPVADIAPTDALRGGRQRAELDLLRDLDRMTLERYGTVSEMEAAVANYELAFRMQSAVPELTEISGESEATRRLYGMDEADTEEYGRACLMARRMVERGVRFIEVLSPRREGIDRWDQHAGLKSGHLTNARATDKPIAGLLRDLKSRGLLDETLVVWGGEFGRSPTAQGTGERTGRDHHPYAFTMWLAGAGMRAGLIHGATDEYGYYVTEGRVHVHDLHATILHLLGLEHTRLTFPFGGRQMRLTDVHGRVARELLLG